MRRLVFWSVLDSWRAEVAHLEVNGDRLVATGTQIGADPVAYRAFPGVRRSSLTLSATITPIALITRQDNAPP